MFYGLARQALFCLDAERAHGLTLAAMDALAAAGLSRLMAKPVPECPRQVMGLRFPNPVGLAAGFDKNGEHIPAFAALGFGHIEVGTVTPRPQPGNPRPRLFRLPQAEAVINRMGFNNEGVDALVANVSRVRYDGVLGVSIGKNADTPIERAADDYLACLRSVYAHADYVAVNVSSPNTKNLRALQGGDELNGLLSALAEERKRLEDLHGFRVPIATKIAPDVDDDALRAIAEAIVRHGMDAIVATNTTLAREGVEGLPYAEETGGLSGAPLRARSTAVIAKLRGLLPASIAILGVGGILSGADAQEKVAAGADLVQIYTGLIFRGPDLVGEVVRALG